MDKTDSENKIYLDENGEVPFIKNMDLYISDDEYDIFMELLDKITLKLINRLENNIKNERKELNDFLIKTKSRKSDIKNAKIIEFARDIYLVFLRFVGKPCYAEIVIIIAVLFDELYDADNVKKWTAKTKDKYNKLKAIVKKHGVSLDDEYSAERMFFKKKGNIQS